MIDIIVPVYNVEDYIDRCVNSVINQTYDKWRLILVDDGSVDSSGILCDQWARFDKRICVIHKDNGGLSSARNAGLDIVKAEYVFFLDSDDWLHKDALRLLHDAIIDGHNQIAICGYIEAKTNVSDCEIGDIINIEYGNGFDLLCRSYVVAWGKLYDSSLFSNLRFPRGKFHEDEYMIHKIAYKIHSAAYVACPLYYYFQRTGSIVNTRNPKKIYDAMGAYIDRMDFSRNVWGAINKCTVNEATKYVINVYSDSESGLNKGERSRLLMEWNGYLHRSEKRKMTLKNRLVFEILYNYEKIREWIDV